MNRRRVGAILTVLAGLWISLSYWFMIPPVVWPLEGPYSWSRVTRAKYSCVSYLRSIEAAKEQAALELGFEDGHVIPEEVVVAYLNSPPYGHKVCPDNGTVTFNALGEAATCDLDGVWLPPGKRKIRVGHFQYRWAYTVSGRYHNRKSSD